MNEKFHPSSFVCSRMENTQSSHTGKSIFRNVLYGLSTWLLPLVLSFISTPIIVRSLGDQDYGIYALVLGFIAYSFNLSFGRAITKYVAEYRASGANEKIRDIISATFFINLTVGIVVIVFIFLTANFFVTDVFEIAADDQSKTVFALYIASLTLFFLILNQVFNSILQGIHRFDVYSQITNFNSAAIISGNIFLAVCGYGLTFLLGWNLLITFFSCLFFIVSAKRHLPEFGISLSFPKETIRIVLKFSAGVIGYQILANLFILFERGWLTRNLGVENLTYYVVPMSLAIYIHSFISSIVLVVFPLASELKNEREKLLRLYLKATKIVCFLVAFIGTTIVIHSRDFLILWMGAEFAEKTFLVLIVHTITFSFLAILNVSWNMTEGLGYPQFNTFLYAICLFVNVVLLLAVTDAYGIVGISLARMTAFIVLFLTLFYVEKWFFGKMQIKFWLRTSAFLIGAMIFSTLLQKFITNSFALGWFWLAASVFGGGIFYCSIIFFSGYATADEKLLLKNILKRR